MRIYWSLVGTALCALISLLFATEIVLQEGNGYSGCKDSFIKSQRPDENNGTAENIGSKYELCHA